MSRLLLLLHYEPSTKLQHMARRTLLVQKKYRSFKLPQVRTVSKTQLSTNLVYNIKNNTILSLPFTSRVPIKLSTLQTVYMLGQQYHQHEKATFLQDFAKIVWFSYRNSGMKADVGWGCMIRVVQMVLAQTIARNQAQLSKKELLDLFKEETNAPLSLNNICKIGNISQRWTSCSQILMVALTIVEQLRQQGTLNMSWQVLCDHIDLQSPNIDCQKFPKMVTIHCQLPNNTITEYYIDNITMLIRDKRFVGLVSGKGSQALYVVGCTQDIAIILDPHYVQQSQQLQSFVPSHPVGIKLVQLSGMLAFSYYIQSAQDLQRWGEEMFYACHSYTHSCFVVQLDIQRRKGSGDFQIM